MFKTVSIYFIFSLVFLYGNTFQLTKKLQYINLLPLSEVYIDKTKDMDIQKILQSSELFEKSKKESLNFGYSPNFNVWIKITLENKSTEKINKIIEYSNPLTTDIEFYDPSKNKVIKDGWLHPSQNRSSVNPTFPITLMPNETKTYYFKLSTKITTLIIKLNLWDEQFFDKKENKHQFILGIFFGSMLILGLYNFFIFTFTKDISYFYYVLYLLGVIFHQGLYTGIFHIYFLSENSREFTLLLASVIAILPTLALAFFMKSFLEISSYKTIHKILVSLMIITPVYVIISIIIENWTFLRSFFPVLLMFYLVLTTIFLVYKKNRQAYFILAGWSAILVSAIIMYLSSVGISEINSFIHQFPYIVEVGFIIEAVIFSLALADRINTLQRDKIESDKKFILQQKSEKVRLQTLVDKKTSGLKQALDEKDLLMKELNHRVKNNLQTIIYLIKLQGKKINDSRIDDILLTIKNRINSMSKLHELLYQQNNLAKIDTKEYFLSLIEVLKTNYTNDIEFQLNIKTNLYMGEAVYCGLIVNELITNSLKYAFPSSKGIISISLIKEDDLFILKIKDNGIGFDITKKKDTLGLLLVETLAQKQLKGNYTISCANGVEVSILWRDND